MGSSSSKPSVPHVQHLMARLKELELEKQQRTAEDLSKGYVFVQDRLEDPSGAAPPQYVEPSSDIEVASMARWQRELLSDPKNRLALSAFTKNAAKDIVSQRSAAIVDQQTFNIRIPLEGSPVTNQRSSGRCWLFASTNVFRIALMKKYNLNDFELSQAYLFFWDKMEKSNYFLESIIDTKQAPLDGRLIQSLMADPIGDGGQWDMVANLVSKYGLVPQTLYPDSFNAMNSSAMDQLITSKLREDALTLRKMAEGEKSSSSISAAKMAMLREVHLILTLMLGPPPAPQEKFHWEFNDADGKYQHVSSSPVDFALQLSNKFLVRAMGGTDVHRLFSLVHDPRNPYQRLLTVDRLGNVYGGRPITYVNVEMGVLKKACIDTLKKGIPVFFGSDVGKYSDSVKGIMDTALYDYQLGFNVRLGMSKAQRLSTHESAMTHAMVLTGVHVEDGQDVRWRVENSWSESAGEKGYFVMTADWFNEFVYQAVIDPTVVDKSVVEVLDQEPLTLPHWDPMGALA